MSEVFEEIQKFINESNVENILPDLLLIQDELKKKYNDLDRIELEANKIADFLNLKESYEEALLDAEKELENIGELINRDEELLAIKTEIENYINQNE
jgi:ABC-type enterochelin transport system substrate-binding protein